MPTTLQRSDKLDIRISPEAKRVLQEAARERHTTISQFVLDSALGAAREVLAERTRIALTSEQWAAFTAALDAPANRHPRMERLLREPTLRRLKMNGRATPQVAKRRGFRMLRSRPL